MLKLILGRAKCGKTTKLLELLKETAAQGKEVLLIVPEQFSFLAERKILNALKGEELVKTSVLNFTSFCNEVKRLYGGRVGKVLDDTSKMIFLHKAIKSLKGNLDVFKGDNISNYIVTVKDAINELKTAGLNSADIKELSCNTEDKLLSLKLSDFAKILSLYESFINEKYIDPDDELSFALKQVRDNGYFKNKTIFFDCFSKFTGQQLKIINQMLIDCDNLYFTFTTDCNFEDEFSDFSNINKTIKRLQTLAHNQSVTVDDSIVLCDSYYKSDDLKFLENNYQNTDKSTYKKLDNITLYEALNTYDELEFVATEIHRLVREEGYRFRDFAVITRSPQNYINIAKSVFKTAQVPLYADEKTPLENTPLALFILSLLKASIKFKTNDIFAYLKSGITDITEGEIAILDDYVYLWNINGFEWKEDFDKNPFGLNEKPSEEIENKLLEINSIRKKVVSPLIRLSNIKEAPCSEYCKALFDILQKCNVTEGLANYAKELSLNGYNTISQYTASSWNAINNILDALYTCFEDDIITFKEFCDILSGAISNYNIGGVPLALDEVLLSSADRAMYSDAKISFVFALNFGEFPQNSTDTGLFSNSERRSLKNSGISISCSNLEDTVDENFMLYSSLTSPTDKLYLSYHTSVYSTGKCEISPTLKFLTSKFSFNYLTRYDIPKYLSVETYAQAFSVYAENNDVKDIKEAIYSLLCENDEYKNKISAISNLQNVKSNYISKDIAKRIYGESIYTSPSKIEQFYKCPYSYFYKYGINIKSREKIDFKFMQRGTIAHYVLENAIKDYKDNLEELCSDKVAFIVRGYVDRYIELTVGNKDTIDNQGKYLLKRICDMLVDLVPFVADELIKSSFKPQEFELRLSNDGDVKPLKINDGECTVTVAGVIDRMDSSEIESKHYIRIVDYKTGVKTFKISDILYGINLQMLIYLCAICENSDFKPAGVLYQPLNHIERAGINSEDYENPKILGIVSDDTKVLASMDPTNSYMPFSINSNGTLSKKSSCLSDDDFKDVFKFIKSKIINMSKQLLDGCISKEPCAVNSSSVPCTYCDYKVICGINESNVETVESYNIEDVLSIIREGENTSGN